MNRNAIETIRRQFGALPADEALCRSFLEDGREFLLGLTFPDPATNYRLLSDFDLAAFPPEAVAQIHRSKQSPFRNMLLIFYRDGDKTGYKLVNGMGSLLFPLADAFCSQ